MSSAKGGQAQGLISLRSFHASGKPIALTADGIVLLIDCVVAISAVSSGLFIETRSKYIPPWTELIKSRFISFENLFYFPPKFHFNFLRAVFFFMLMLPLGECVQHGLFLFYHLGF